LYSSIESEFQLAASSDGDNRFAKQFGAIPNGPTVRRTAVILPLRASAERGFFSVACSRKQEEIENFLLLPPASRK